VASDAVRSAPASADVAGVAPASLDAARLVPADRVVVPFAGPGAGTGPLSWGQIENWNAIRALGHWMPIGGVEPVPPGTTVADVVADVEFLMSRFVTMRTRLLLAPGAAPRQQVAAAGELTVEIYDAGTVDAAAVAEAVAERYRTAPFDFTAEWPVRIALIRADGTPTRLVTLLSHFAADGSAAQTMLREIAEKPRDPVDGLSPLEQARWQHSPAGQRQNASAQRYFEGTLRAMPALRFRTPEAPRSPRYWRAVLESAALPRGLRALTDRTGADSSVTLLAVYAVAVHETFGVHPVVVRPMVNNRFRPGLGDIVCTVVQPGLCLLDVAGADLDEVVRRTERVALSTYKHAYFDQRGLFTLLDRVGRERGEHLEIGCFLNDRRMAADPPEAPAFPSTVRWVRKQDSPGFEPLIVDVEDIPGGLRCTAHTDTRWISPEDTEALLHAMEAVAARSTVDRPTAPANEAVTAG